MGLWVFWFWLCPNGTASPALEDFAGVWKHSNPDSGNDTITITGNTFTKEWEAVGNSTAGSKTGTFVFDAETITFTTNANEVLETPYELTDEYLHLTKGKFGWSWYGRFYKQ